MQPYKHPSGFDLATIPQTQRPENVRDVLVSVALEIEKEMRLIAKSWKKHLDLGHKRGLPRDKSLYDGLNVAIGVLQRHWQQLGRRDNILAIMPPTDGYDDNGDEHEGIADYCALIAQDIPW